MVGRAEGRSGLLSEATADLAIPLRKAAGSPASKPAKGCPQPPKGLPAPRREIKVAWGGPRWDRPFPRRGPRAGDTDSGALRAR